MTPRKPPPIQPIYDEVYRAGAAWIDSLAHEQAEPARRSCEACDGIEGCSTCDGGGVVFNGTCDGCGETAQPLTFSLKISCGHEVGASSAGGLVCPECLADLEEPPRQPDPTPETHDYQQYDFTQDEMCQRCGDWRPAR
jgi:hypothetical protein